MAHSLPTRGCGTSRTGQEQTQGKCLRVLQKLEDAVTRVPHRLRGCVHGQRGTCGGWGWRMAPPGVCLWSATPSAIALPSLWVRDGTYHCQNERHGVPTTIARVDIDQVLHYNNRRWRTSENQAASQKPQRHGLAGPTGEPVFSTVQSSPSASALESITRCSIVYHTLQRLASQHGVPQGWATRC